MNSSSAFGASLGIVMSPYLWRDYGFRGACVLWVGAIVISGFLLAFLWRALLKKDREPPRHPSFLRVNTTYSDIT